MQLKKNVSFEVNLTRKQVEDILFDYLCDKYDDHDVDFKDIRSFDNIDVSFNNSSNDETFCSVMMDKLSIDLRKPFEPIQNYRRKK